MGDSGYSEGTPRAHGRNVAPRRTLEADLAYIDLGRWATVDGENGGPASSDGAKTPDMGLSRDIRRRTLRSYTQPAAIPAAAVVLNSVPFFAAIFSLAAPAVPTPGNPNTRWYYGDSSAGGPCARG